MFRFERAGPDRGDDNDHGDEDDAYGSSGDSYLQSDSGSDEGYDGGGHDSADFQDEAASLAWSATEEQQVLNFYGLETLALDQWPDAEPESPSSASPIDDLDGEVGGGELSVGAPATGGMVTGTAAFAGLSSMTSAREQLQTDQDPLGIKGSISRIIRSKVGDDDGLMEKVKLTSVHFNARLFLKTVHDTTQFRDLQTGKATLERAVSERTETMKNLVKQNFERFVNAKNTVDTVYIDMKKNVFSKPEMGLQSITKSTERLGELIVKIYGPVIERRNREEQIRAQLDALSRHKFIFKLASNLEEAIAQERYNDAIRDYQKGSGIMPKLTHIKTFAKIWQKVETLMQDLKSRLLARLSSDQSLSHLESVERTILNLMDLRISEDPVQIYLHHQSEHIIRQMRTKQDEYTAQWTSFLATLCQVRGSLLAQPGQAGAAFDSILAIQNPAQLSLFRTLLTHLTTKQLDTKLTQMTELVEERIYWQTKTAFIVDLCDLFDSLVPPFWAWLQGLLQGKYFQSREYRRTTLSIQAMLRFLTAAIMGALAGTDADSTKATAAISPDWSRCLLHNSFYIVQYGKQILSRLYALLENLHKHAVDAADLEVALRLLTSAQEALLARLAECSALDCQRFQYLEDWRLVSEGDFLYRSLKHDGSSRDAAYQERRRSSASSAPGTTSEAASSATAAMTQTNYHYCQFVKYLLRAGSMMFVAPWTLLRGFGALSELRDLSAGRRPSSALIEPVSARLSFFTAQCERLFYEWLTVYLSGIQALSDLAGSTQAGRSTAHPLPSSDVQCLLLASNVDALAKVDVPAWISAFADYYLKRIDSAQLDILMRNVQLLTQDVYHEYIKRKGVRLIDWIRANLSQDSFLWSSESLPNHVRAYVFDCLLELMRVHHQVSQHVPDQLGYVLGQLVMLMAHELRDCVNSISSFHMGGMFQITAELEFVQVALLPFTLPEAKALFDQLYTLLEQKTVVLGEDTGKGQVPLPASERKRVLQAQYPIVSRVIQQERERSAIQLSCFATCSPGK